ncbi:MAG: pimeloyl-ACP methyl ester carboxylesterase [Glaciecola sp.]|jgi:pimeloyl-ACP methyl ester carboxylesterase|uniref:alpha/beta fold hydrolase n=1 Tax=Congregibacter sp. TaxID=2744308 RepID=UPI0039E33F14
MGDPGGAPILMIMGLGASSTVWGDEFPAGLVDKGFTLVLVDNRDVGGSQKFDK